jgi:hypothetical protein
MPTIAQLKGMAKYKEELENMNEWDLWGQQFRKKPRSRESVQLEIEKRAKLVGIDPRMWLLTIPKREQKERLKLKEQTNLPNDLFRNQSSQYGPLNKDKI